MKKGFDIFRYLLLGLFLVAIIFFILEIFGARAMTGLTTASLEGNFNYFSFFFLELLLFWVLLYILEQVI